VDWVAVYCCTSAIINYFSRKVYVKNSLLFFIKLIELFLEKQTYELASPFAYRVFALLLGDHFQMQNLSFSYY